MDEKNNKNKVVHNSNINWLACIYAEYHLNPYKMEILNK